MWTGLKLTSMSTFCRWLLVRRWSARCRGLGGGLVATRPQTHPPCRYWPLGGVVMFSRPIANSNCDLWTTYNTNSNCRFYIHLYSSEMGYRYYSASIYNDKNNKSEQDSHQKSTPRDIGTIHKIAPRKTERNWIMSTV